MTKKKRKKKPAKRPPKPAPEPRKAKRVPIGKKAKRTPIKDPGGRPTKTQVLVPEDSFMDLRYAASKDYAYTFRDISIAELCRHPRYAHISPRTMERWCAEDGWVEMRRAFRDEYRKEMEKAIGTQIVQARLAYTKLGDELLDDSFKRLLTKDKKKLLEVKSREGLMRATVMLWDRTIAEKEKLADAIMPEPIAHQQSEHYTPAVQPQLTKEEAREAALTIVRMRREQIRARIKQEMAAEQGEEPEKPHMRVIDGEK